MQKNLSVEGHFNPLMKLLSYLFTVLMLLILSVTSYAGIADLSLSVEFDGIENGVTFQQQGTFRVTVTNNGPEAAGTNSALSTPIAVFSDFVELADDGTEMNFELDSSITQECGFGLIAVDPRPGEPPGFVFVFRTPVIQPNTSITCHGIYSINFSSGTRTYQWNVNGHIDDSDPNFLNNLIPITFGVAPRQVPSINLIGLALLTLISLFVTHRKLLKP